MIHPENAIPGVAIAKEIVRSPSARIGIGIVAVAGATMYGMATGAIHMQQAVGLQGGRGEVVDVRAITPEECLSAYSSDIRGVQADFNTTLNIGPLKLPTSYSDKEEYNGVLTSKVCTHPTQYVIHVDTKTHHATADIPASAFSTTVYAENPVKDDVHTVHNGLAMAALKNVTNIVKVIPSINFEGKTDDLVGNLRALAFLDAQSIQAKACGTAAWPYLKPIETTQLQDLLAHNIDVQEPFIASGQAKLTPSEITIDLPQTMTFTTQYSDKLNAAAAAMKSSGITFTNSQRGVVCKPSPHLKPVTTTGQ